MKKEIKVRVEGKWMEISSEHLRALCSEEFARIEAIEINELMSKEEFKRRYPKLTNPYKIR